MTNFFTSEETIEVDLGDGFWVELKRELTFGEESELEGAPIRAGVNPDGTPRVEFSLREQRTVMLSLYIVAWNLQGGNGKVVALPDDLTKRRALVTSLRPAWARRLIAKIEEIRAAEAELDRPAEDAADENPTPRGAASAPGTRSSSRSGLAVATTT